MLHGSFTAKIDDKGRVKVPSEFRRLIQDRYGESGFYVTSVRGDCAHLYPSRVWSEILDKLSTQPASKPPVRKFRLATSYYGQNATSDPQGRVVIHPRLRADAGIEDEVIILGQQNHLEVWNLKRFKEALKSDPVNTEDEDYLAQLGV